MEFSLIHVLFGEKSYSYWVFGALLAGVIWMIWEEELFPKQEALLITIRVGKDFGTFFCGTCWSGRQWLASGSAPTKKSKGNIDLMKTD